MIGPTPDCLKCKHYNPNPSDGLTCQAFPKGIPVRIILGDDHNKPLPNQGMTLFLSESKIVLKK